MGFWVGIKRAINSTLGTSEFQSLDKIIKGQKSLIKSDNLYYSFPQVTYQNVTSGNNEVIKELIKFKCSGSCRIVAEDMTGVSMLWSRVYINGTQVATGGSNTLSAEVNFKANDVLSIGLGESVNSQKYTVNINDLRIYADIIDNSALEIL